MEECKVCGRTNPVEGANFCYYCGTSFREVGASDPREELRREFQKAEEEPVTVPTKKMSKWQWMATFLLLFLPVYGWLAFLVVVCLSAFGASSSEERKEMARGLLLFVGISVVFTILAFIYLMKYDPEFTKMFEEMMNQASTGMIGWHLHQ